MGNGQKNEGVMNCHVRRIKSINRLWVLSAAVLVSSWVVLLCGSLDADKIKELKVGLEWRFKLVSKVPIKNITEAEKGTLENYENVLDADFIALTIAATAKEALQFSAAVSDWSRVVFIEAPCYVPLCGDDAPRLGWKPTDIQGLPNRQNRHRGRYLQDPNEPNFQPTENTEFDICCAVADTEPEGPNDECVVSPVQSCRLQEFVSPCGATIVPKPAQDRSLLDLSPRVLQVEESDAECVDGDAKMELALTFEREASPETCCVTCSCYGDPRCVSFDDESDLWVLCDARAPADPEDSTSQCVISEAACEQLLDHEENECHWIELDPEEEDEWTTLINGSRCVPNLDSGDSWIVMYEFEDFNFEIRQAERGIIDEVSILFGGDAFTMTAEDCDRGEFNRTWKDPEGDENDFVVPTTSFAQIIETPTELYKEILWVVSDPDTLIQARIRCLRQRDDEGRQSAPRIHVDALVEPEINFRDVRDGADGFCVTSDLEQVGSTDATDEIESGDRCKANGLLSQGEEMGVARALCGQSLLYSSVALCIVSFCEENYFPNFDEYTDCVDLIRDGDTGFDFRDGFCIAMTFTEADKEDCFALWDNLDGLSGPLAAIEKYYGSVALRGEAKPIEDCAEGVADLPESLGACEPGVELQYLDSSLQWVTFIAMPQRFPPCGNLEFNINDHEPLFINPIRLKQCTINSACITSNDNICESQAGFAAMFLLKPGELDEPDTKKPTESPTKGPSVVETDFPTEFPTQSPTESPEVSPTKFPTEYPTRKPVDDWSHGHPTESPTESPEVFPTKYPTKYPSRKPIDDWSHSRPTEKPTISPVVEFPPTIDPTPFPTDSPTTRPTESPTAFPTLDPTAYPSETPTLSPTTPAPTESPTEGPSLSPSHQPTVTPTKKPTEGPTTAPTLNPTKYPTEHPTESPTQAPTVSPTAFPTISPTDYPTTSPSSSPTQAPTKHPTDHPTQHPTITPTTGPSESPTITPTNLPTEEPTKLPTESPTTTPSLNPTVEPTWSPSEFPTAYPTKRPTTEPTKAPTESPTESPTLFPTVFPSENPTHSPTETPTTSPVEELLEEPTVAPTKYPTTWSKGNTVFDFGNKGHIVGSRYGKVLNTTVHGNEKLKYKDAGEVVFIGIYKNMDAAENELFAANVEDMLQEVNRFLDNQGDTVFAVSCEMRLLQENPPGQSPSGASGAANNDGLDFLNLGNSWRSITAAVAAGFMVVVLSLLVLAAARSSGRGRSRGASRLLDLASFDL